MKKIKEKFENDPVFAVGVLLATVVVGTGALRAIAKTIESSAYAYRASKI